MKAETHPEPQRELIESLKAGDDSAFKDIYALYKDRVHSLCLHMVSSSDDASELTQRIFVKLLAAAYLFEHRSSFSTWLYRLSMNVCYDYIRMKKKERTITLDDLPSETLSEEQHDTIDISQTVQDALQLLKPKLRIVMILKYVEDLSYAEIAEVVGCSVGTVGSRLNRGHKFLAKKLAYLKDAL